MEKKQIFIKQIFRLPTRKEEMTCEHKDCTNEATEYILEDIFQESRWLCKEHYKQAELLNTKENL